MERLLFTGNSGFLGKNVVPILEQNYNVYGIHNGENTNLLVQKNVERILKVFKPDIVVHAAGTVGGIGANKDNPGKFMYENLVMGTNIIHESYLAGVRKFIMIGTVCAYPKFTPTPFKEEMLWDGYPEETNAPYGIAKKTLMKLVETYHEQYGFNGVNLVPVNMYGPHDHFNLTSSHVIPALILKVQNAINKRDGSITLWGTGKASREFLFAEDCAGAIQSAISHDVGPSPINVGTGIETTIESLIETICAIMGYTGNIVYDTSKPDGQPHRCLDVTKAKELLGFEARTNLEDGLRQTIEWFQRNVK